MGAIHPLGHLDTVVAVRLWMHPDVTNAVLSAEPEVCLVETALVYTQGDMGALQKIPARYGKAVKLKKDQKIKVACLQPCIVALCPGMRAHREGVSCIPDAILSITSEW